MTVTHNSNEEIIGRSEINDIDAILAIPLADPNEVEHVVKVHVRQNRRDHTALRGAEFRVRHRTGLHHARVEPLADEAQQRPVSHP